MSKRKIGPVVKNRPDARKKGVNAPQWLAQAGVPRAVICGREYLAVEGCGQVEEFSPACIALCGARGAVRIEGAGLSISRECEHTVVVRGRIDRISFGGADV